MKPLTAFSFRSLALILPLIISGVFSLPGPTGGAPDQHQNLEEAKRDLPTFLASTLGDILSLDIIGDIIRDIDRQPAIELEFPGLKLVLQKLQADRDVKPDDHLRRLLATVQKHATYGNAYKALSPELQEKVKTFLGGKSAEEVIGKRDFFLPPSPAVKQHFEEMESVGGTVSSRAWLNAKRQVSPVVYEDAAGTKVMKVHVNAHFENWGLTVANTPALTFVPTTVLGISNIVKWAKLNGKRVRASGYRHTWTDMYSADNEVLVSMLDIETVTTIPDPTSLEKTAEFPGNELKVIELEPTDVPGSGGKKRLVRIGAAVTNEELRRWSVANDAWSMAVNVIMVEITLGGSNVPICHGAGLRHKTVSDIVRKISYVDANGNPQTVDGSNPELLRAAAGSFGLLGVITHITFELDKMTYAVMKPEKTNVNLAIPPPADYTVPPALQKFYFPSQLSAARAEFVNKANTKYFSEWFWFPYQDEVFVNCWDTTTDRTGVKDYPSPPDVFLQWLQGWIGGVLNDDPLWRALPGLWQATILGTLAHTSQPPYGPLDTEIRTYLTDALHFRRGIQNMRVRDMELQIPIPPLASDPTKPDYGIVQRAWWDAILETYKDPRAPMRIALELRIMGGSDMIMAPQRGNGFGTASIEVVTSMAAAADGSWMPFAQRLADKWMALRDGAGVRLKTRPHWAKEWDWMKVDGMPWKDYLRTVSYKDEIPQFLQAVSDIGSSQGWTVADAKARFSVGLLDDVFFG